MPPASPSIRYYRFHGRLAQFRQFEVGPAHWDERWSGSLLKQRLAANGNGNLGEFTELFTRYLPKDMPVLEAGCGPAHLVKALANRGYRVEGVDYGEQTVSAVRSIAPELQVRLGDVYNLDVDDQHYGGYISIGVFEHDPGGPLKGLRETARVLSRHGFALLSVPFLNQERRRWLEKVPEATEPELSNGLKFYQYYFSPEEMESHIRGAGLEVVESYPYSVEAGLMRDFTFLHWLQSKRRGMWRLRRPFNRLCAHSPLWMRWRLAHMIMFVCRRGS